MKLTLAPSKDQGCRLALLDRGSLTLRSTLGPRIFFLCECACVCPSRQAFPLSWSSPLRLGWLVILLSLPLQNWNYKYMPPWLALYTDTSSAEPSSQFLATNALLETTSGSGVVEGRGLQSLARPLGNTSNGGVPQGCLVGCKDGALCDCTEPQSHVGVH